MCAVSYAMPTFLLPNPYTPDFFKGRCSACSERQKGGPSFPEEVRGGLNLLADALLTHPGFALRGMSGSSSQRHPSARAMLAGVRGTRHARRIYANTDARRKHPAPTHQTGGQSLGHPPGQLAGPAPQLRNVVGEGERTRQGRSGFDATQPGFTHAGRLPAVHPGESAAGSGTVTHLGTWSITGPINCCMMQQMGTTEGPQVVENAGGREGVRTPGLGDANAALSQLSYTPDSV